MEPDVFLPRHPPFDRLQPNLLERVLERLEVTYVPRGEAVMRRSDPENRNLFVVRKGAVRLERDGLLLQVLEEGEVFGYPSLLAGGPPSTDVVAEEDSLLFRIPGDVFHRLMEEREFADFFVAGLASRLRRAAQSESPLLSGDLSTPVADLVTRAAVFVRPEATVAEAARAMTREGVSSILVSGRPLGIVTDRDLRRRVLARGRPADTPVSRVMSRPLRTLPAGTAVFEALVAMLENSIHHLALVEGDEVLGVVTDSDLLRHHHRSPIYLLSRVEKMESAETFPDYSGQLSGMVEVLFRGSLDAVEIGRIVSSVNDAAASRLLRLTERELGEPPCAYAWIVFGSEGRREQALLTDQDNALVYADDSDEARRYFADLAERVVGGLIRLGIPPCPGGFMADRWHHPLAVWLERFSGWLGEPEPQALIDAANFFDFRSVHGELSLAPLDEVIAEARSQRSFLAHMAKNALEFRPPIGLFRQIRERSGAVDLKRGGIIPVVSLARLFALEGQVLARSTVDRLAAAAAAGSLSAEGAETLSEAFRFLLRLRLGHQLEAVREGRPADNSVPLDDLSHLTRRHLKEAFLAIREIQEAVSLRYGTAMLG